MPGSDTSDASSNDTEIGLPTRRVSSVTTWGNAAAAMLNVPRRRPVVEPPPLDLVVDGVVFQRVFQVRLVQIRALLPSGLQLGLTPNHPLHAMAVPPPGSSIQDRLHPPGVQGLLLPANLPPPPARVTPEQVADALEDIAIRMEECTSASDACQAVLEVALAQRRESGEAGLTGEAPTDKYRTESLQNLLNDTDLARQVIQMQSEAYREWAQDIRKPAINNGRETVAEVFLRDDKIGWIVIRQPVQTDE